MSKHKIIFYLEQDEDGYPGFGSETVWASDAEATGTYVTDNIPFFAKQATLGDIVMASRTEAGLVFENVITRSANSLIRVIVYNPWSSSSERS